MPDRFGDKNKLLLLFICQPCRFSTAVDECLQVAPRIINYLLSSLKIINYFPIFIVAADAQA